MNYIQWAHLPKVNDRLIKLYNVLIDIKKSEILIQLEDYICFPLVQIINDKKTSKQNIEMVLKCLTYIIEHVNCVLSVELFQNFLVASAKCASQESNSEELKYSAIHCILCLVKFYPNREEIILKNEDSFKKKNIADRNNLNSKLYKMVVPHIISICLDLAQKEKLLILRLEALEVLRYLVDLLNYNTIVKFVPGIISNLLKTCIESSNDNHRVLVNSLIVLDQVICKAFNDNINSRFLKRNDSLSWNDLQNLYKDKNKNDEISINSNNSNNNNKKIKKNELKDVEKNEIEKMFDQNDLKVESEVVTEEWLSISSVKILNLLNALTNIRGHSHQNVRKQFILFSKSIIQQCKLTLQLCMETLVEILVYYLNDEIEEISVLCLETINEVSKEFKNNQQFLELLKKNFEKLILSFPRLLTSSSDKTKLEMINLANGYLILLKDESTILIQTSIELLANSLIEILTFDISDVRLIEDRYNYNNSQVDILEASKNTKINDIGLFFETKEAPDDQILRKESNNEKEVEENSFYRFSSQYYRYSRFFPKKNFKYIHDDKVIKVLSQLCHLIGYYGDISFLIDYILNTYIINNNFTDNTITPIYLLNEVCMGGYHRLNNDKKNASKKEIISNRIKLYFNLLENILFEYTHSKVLDMPTSLMDEKLFSDIDYSNSNSNRDNGTSTTLTNRINNPYHPHIDNEQFILSENKIESFNEIILKNCLILEGISTISLIMRDNFKIHLMETLYILLEKLGDINRTISDLAMSCLNLVSKACGYTSASELILDNVDYIINIVTQKLRYIEYNIKAPRVLKAAIEVSQYPIIQYMNDTIDELCEILDQNKTNPGLGCLVIDVFQALMTVLNRHSLLQQENNNNMDNHSNKNEKENDIIKPNGVSDRDNENKKEMENKKSSNNPTNNAFIEKMIQSNIFQQADPEIQSFFLKNLSLNSSDEEEEEDDDDNNNEKYNNDNNNNDSIDNNKENSTGKSLDTNEGKRNNNSNSINKIENYFKNYHKKKEDKNNFENEKAIEENDQHPREHEGINIEEKNENEEGKEEIDEEKSVEMNYDQKLCLKVVKETSYYINSDSPELRSKSLRVIKASFQIFGYYPKELYPMVHQLWPTLLKRLNDPANHVIKDTIQLINEMITTTTIGADFLNRAVADELLPILFRYIEEYNEKIMPIEVFKRAPNTKRRKDFEKVKYQKGKGIVYIYILIIEIYYILFSKYF